MSVRHSENQVYNAWEACIDRIYEEIPQVQFNTWIRPLKVMAAVDHVQIIAPNRFIRDFVSDKYSGLIQEHWLHQPQLPLVFSVAKETMPKTHISQPTIEQRAGVNSALELTAEIKQPKLVPLHQHNLVDGYTFDNFVEGKSNQLALAAAAAAAAAAAVAVAIAVAPPSTLVVATTEW